MLPDDFRIDAVDASAAPTLVNLFEHYLHDMAEWFGFDTEQNGAYGYPAQKCWDNGAVVYFAYAGGVPIGFAIVTAAESPVETRTLDLKEFFVVRRHRRSGVGRAFANTVWDRHPGPWLVRVYRGNLPALPFWRGCVADYSGGRFRELERESNDKLWSYFTFRSGDTR
jgi:predicted acetyltransferase